MVLLFYLFLFLFNNFTVNTIDYILYENNSNYYNYNDDNDIEPNSNFSPQIKRYY